MRESGGGGGGGSEGRGREKGEIEENSYWSQLVYFLTFVLMIYLVPPSRLCSFFNNEAVIYTGNVDKIPTISGGAT